MDRYDGKARPDSWQTTPMPARTVRLPFTGSYSLEEYERLARGLVPEVMEDKWFIFENDGTISFHRSWTGICAYEVRLERVGERYRVTEARANNDFREYGVGSRAESLVYAARLLRFLIENLLLGRRQPFPLEHGMSDETGIIQHAFSGTGYPAE